MILKFRAWNKIDKVMIKDLNSPVMMHGVLLIHSDDILMQFTGLTDKNGQDIYEGDIVDCQTGADGFIEQRGVVVAELSYNGLLPLVCSETQEIIGNIHMHPELMEKDDE